MVLLLLIIGLVEVASGALIHIAATAVKHVVGLKHAQKLLSDTAGGCSFWYCLFGNIGVFIPPRIDLTVAFFDLIRVFFEQTATFRGRDWRLQDVRYKLNTSLRHTKGQLRLWDSKILANLLQRQWVRIRLAQRWRSSGCGDDCCGDAGCGNVTEHLICCVLRSLAKALCKNA